MSNERVGTLYNLKGSRVEYTNHNSSSTYLSYTLDPWVRIFNLVICTMYIYSESHKTWEVSDDILLFPLVD